MKNNSQGEDLVTSHNFSGVSVIRRKSLKQLFSIPWPENFKSKIVIIRPLGCWNWTGATKAHPEHPEYRYPVYGNTGAHQFAYQFAHGLLLPGLRLDVDHACQNKLCVNPRHLRPLTHQDNCRLRRKRGRVVGSKRWLKEQLGAK